MNTKTARQIEEMKKQTIGVEVEMNNITRNKAAKIAAEFFGTGRFENTADRNSYCTWSAYDEQGREWMSASQDPTARSAKWLHQSLPTQTLKHYRNL